MKSTLYRFADGLYWIPDDRPPKAKYGEGPFESHRAAFVFACCQLEERFSGERRSLWLEVVRLLGADADPMLLWGIGQYIRNGAGRDTVLKMARQPKDRRMLAAGDR